MDKSLRELRLEAGLTQAELARSIGCNVYLYNKIEDVERDFVRVQQIAKKFLEGQLRNEALAKSKLLRRMRMQAGLTQLETAVSLNCSATYYSYVERGKTDSSPIRDAAIALFEEILKGGKKP